MPWRAITVEQVLGEFTTTEKTMLDNIQGSSASLEQILGDTIGEFIGAMNAAGYGIKSDGTVPDQLRRHIIARVRWGLLISFPALIKFQTKERKEAADAAEKILENITLRKAGAIEDPAGTVSSNKNWNSENRLVLRTHPAPPASQQSPPTLSGPPYANPDADPDN